MNSRKLGELSARALQSKAKGRKDGGNGDYKKISTSAKMPSTFCLDLRKLRRLTLPRSPRATPCDQGVATPYDRGVRPRLLFPNCIGLRVPLLRSSFMPVESCWKSVTHILAESADLHSPQGLRNREPADLDCYHYPRAVTWLPTTPVPVLREQPGAPLAGFPIKRGFEISRKREDRSI